MPIATTYTMDPDTGDQTKTDTFTSVNVTVIPAAQVARIASNAQKNLGSAQKAAADLAAAAAATDAVLQKLQSANPTPSQSPVQSQLGTERQVSPTPTPV